MSRTVAILLLSTVCVGQNPADPWAIADIVQPSALAAELQGRKAPAVLCVAFPVLYRSRHILHAIEGGAASKPEGLDTLRKAVADISKDADLVIYCGCCPMVKCPNVRPAYRLLKELGFTHVRVLDIPTNMHTDWFSRNYPSSPAQS